MKKTNFSAIMAVLCLCALCPSVSNAQINKADFFDENGAYFGPTTEETNYSGAYYTGKYESPFKTYLGKTDEEIQAKLDQLWNHYFGGVVDKTIYYEGRDGAYIVDISNNDVRSEGMSYGMMIAVQTDHKDEFDKLWQWSKLHLWHDPEMGGNGYFSWQANRDGSVRDQGNVPDAEVYYMMSLLFAANRWNDAGYMEDAQTILKSCWKSSTASLFSEQSYVITFQPTEGNNSWSDPSYSLPAFVDLFGRWSKTNNDKWKKATAATRNHIYRSANSKSGLFSDYSNFDGTPHYAFGSNSIQYAFDAIRCPMNYGMDYYLFGVDAERQTKIAKLITDFFENDNYKHAHFNWDGTEPNGSFTIGQAGANAVATYALLGDPSYEKLVKKVLQKAWDAMPIMGRDRYYDGIVHYMAMLYLCGSFKIWKPKPNIKTKNITANVYNGVTYTEKTTIYSYEEGQLYLVTITPGSTPDPDPDLDPDPENPPTPVSSVDNAPTVKVWSYNRTIFIETAPDTKYTIIDLSGRILKSATTQSTREQIKFNTQGIVVIIINGESFKLAL